MPTDPLFYAVAGLAVILLGLSKGGFIGLGLAALPMLSLFIPPMQAAALLLPTLLAQDVLTVWVYRRDWSAWNLKVLLPGMVLGVALASLFAAALSAAHIRLAIGLITGLFVLRQALAHWFERLTPRPTARSGFLFGIMGGFGTLLANAGGPAWQMHLLPQRLDKLTFVGTVTMMFAASNVMKIPALGALGQFNAENLAVGAMLLPVALAANYFGIWLVRRTPTELFYKISYVLITLIAVELIRGATFELLHP